MKNCVWIPLCKQMFVDFSSWKPLDEKQSDHRQMFVQAVVEVKTLCDESCLTLLFHRNIILYFLYKHVQVNMKV